MPFLATKLKKAVSLTVPQILLVAAHEEMKVAGRLPRRTSPKVARFARTDTFAFTASLESIADAGRVGLANS
jgi:hypothetical protein